MAKDTKQSFKCIVTGGLGFIGSHITDRLIKDGHDVLVIDNMSTGYLENLNPKARIKIHDIKDLIGMPGMFEGADYVFHTAACPRIQPSIKNPLLTNDNNIRGILNVLLCARDAGVKRVIYSASSSCYGTNEPPCHEEMQTYCLSPYSISKYVGEMYCKNFFDLYGLDTVSLRYFNVYGNRMDDDGDYATVIGIFRRQAANGEALTIVGDGEQRRDFTYISDNVEANILAMQHEGELEGQVINIGTGKNYSVNEIAKMIGDKFEYLPARKGEAKATLADNNKAEKVLGWKPKVTLAEGIKKLT